MDKYITKKDVILARPERLELVDDFSAGFNICIDEYIDKIDGIPAADVMPVRHGRWIVTAEFTDCIYAQCDQCKITQVFYHNKPLTNYCPNCGAKMNLHNKEG